MGGNFVNQQKENCMKNNIFKIIIFFLALVSLGACDDGCEDYLDQYESILYFKNNGEQHVTIYDTSNEASCEFTVIRDRKSTRLNSSHVSESRMPSSA